jgi:hypothetical protein
VNEVVADFEVLRFMPTYQLQNALANGALVHRINHLLRNVPGNEDIFSSAAQTYDEAVLAVPQRISGSFVLPPISRRLARASQRHGGMGYRTWGDVADCAYLAAYVHISHVFNRLFPDLVSVYPDVLSLKRQGQTGLTSSPAHFAFRALTRIEALAPTVRATLQRDADGPIGHLQHSLSALVDDFRQDALGADIAASDRPDNPRNSAHYLSECGDPDTFSVLPYEPNLQLSNAEFQVATKRRLLLPIDNDHGGKLLRCPTCNRNNVDGSYTNSEVPLVDSFGDHALHCVRGSDLRTKLWHDPLVQEFYNAVKRAGVRGEAEPESAMLTSNQRPDVVANPTGGPRIITDVITCDPTTRATCVRAANIPGYAADQGQAVKDRRWADLATSEGDHFFALAIESGGRIGDNAMAFVKRLADIHGFGNVAASRAFTASTVQRLHLVNKRGVSKLILGAPRRERHLVRSLGES